ncbi:hypothetical protein HOL21_00685 [Candidatus Woesearchaeota archaeon]|jgi:hypothetical protein|nr:hypothetical protein [Candidatus Woesearchaeota archaeon]MBT5396712.1 hypothetical protein [Candidatus Woesearchaeota archaeon]MBT5924328.1 hypothetical protein [Candidatus Woesearchaeota archaeon]MBT6367501.1 hypothetical protein [Candidatus Woesearchaeota archaeon]MBT7763000.1 hypothetical protein [Candidatus Woesearchaeota archaeon]
MIHDLTVMVRTYVPQFYDNGKQPTKEVLCEAARKAEELGAYEDATRLYFHSGNKEDMTRLAIRTIIMNVFSEDKVLQEQVSILSKEIGLKERVKEALENAWEKSTNPRKKGCYIATLKYMDN